MAGDWQLDPPPTAGDYGAVTESMEDETSVTSWPDGTSRVDYPDGSATVTYPDFAVLNLFPDGRRTLTDAEGTSYDPYSGAPLYDLEAPLYGAEEIQNILSGGKVLGTLGEAKELVEAAADSVRGAVDPVEWVGQVINAILEVVRALETPERGCFLRGWCYTLLYGALDMGEPPEPAFAGHYGGPDQDELNRVAWWEGVAKARADLNDGESGNAMRNKILIQVALNGGDATTTLRKMWSSACAPSDDWQLAAAYDHLSWPEPIGA